MFKLAELESEFLQGDQVHYSGKNVSDTNVGAQLTKVTISSFFEVFLSYHVQNYKFQRYYIFF